MTATGNRSLVRGAWALVRAWSVVLGPVLISAAIVSGEDGALSLRASVIGAAQSDPLTVELYRWSTDAERAPMMTALSAPPPAPAAPAAPAGGRAGRGGRGGRGAAAAPPLSPLARLTASVKAAPTLGYIWSGGPTGY